MGYEFDDDLDLPNTPTTPGGGSGASTRSQIVRKAKIGNIEFTASRATGGGKRRLAIYEAIGIDGAEIDDLGEGPRIETLEASLDEVVYWNLENLRREGQVQTIVHPLFPIFQGRIHELTYDANEKERVNAKIILVEDGEWTLSLAPVVITLGQASQNAKNAADDLFSAGLDDLDLPDDLASANVGMNSAWTDLDGVLDQVELGEASWFELGGAFDLLGDAADSLITAVDGAIDDVVGLAELSIDDFTYDLMGAARSVVDAAQQDVAAVWEPIKTTIDRSVADVALQYLGADDEDAENKILQSNPGIIDLNLIPAGFDLLIPVEL